jgi:C1A family cysteine protease
MEVQNKMTLVELSRLWIYYQERALEGTVGQDSGAYLRDGIKACAQLGVCSEAIWPYAISRYRQRPPTRAYADAGTRKITQYLRVDMPGADLRNGIKSCLLAGYPIAFGFTVYDSFQSDAVATTGVVPMPDLTTENVLGGHAIGIYGWYDSRQQYICRNEWGTTWGDHGWCYMPYAYVENPNLSSDFWTVRR